MHETDLLDRRPSPEDFLARLRADEPAGSAGGRGRLRIYLGMAPGVGKTFRMLEEGHRRVARGTDVVVGFVETHGRPRTAELLDGLEIVPRRVVVHRGVTVEEMDPDAVIARRPTVALIDELAHTNVPGSPADKRWQDVERIRDAGIHVVSTLNVQHLESQADAVQTITGAPVHERLPDNLVAAADELELVDMSPHALRQRMRHGNIYGPGAARMALDRFFTEENLTALRELALRLVARSVENQLDGMASGSRTNAVAAVSERVLVLVDGSAAGRPALRSAATLAARLRADLVALVPEQPEGDATWERDRAIRADVDYAGDLGGIIVRLRPGDVAAEIGREARERGSTHLVLPHVPRRGLARMRPSLAEAILAVEPRLEIHLVGAREAVHPG